MTEFQYRFPLCCCCCQFHLHLLYKFLSQLSMNTYIKGMEEREGDRKLTEECTLIFPCDFRTMHLPSNSFTYLISICFLHSFNFYESVNWNYIFYCFAEIFQFLFNIHRRTNSRSIFTVSMIFHQSFQIMERRKFIWGKDVFNCE